MYRITKIKVVLIFIVTLLTACQLKEVEIPNDEVTVKLKWVHQAQFAGMYVAVDKGFYEEQNLTVNLLPFTFEEPTMDAVIQGQADFGVKSASEIISAREEGAPVKAIAVIYKYSPLCLYSLKESGISKPQDFVGRTVGLKPGQITIAYQVMLNKLGIDRSQITEIEIGYGVEELIDGTVDVSSGFSINEPHQVIEAGHEVNIMLFEDYGVQVYDDVLFATEDTIINNPDLVERFLRATLKGWQYAIENEEVAVDIVLKYTTDRTRSHEAYMLNQSVPLIHTGNSRIGWMERERWVFTGNVLLEAGLIEEGFNFDEAYTMQFLEEIYGESD
jgi:NitT/TauT family transport system substrate-binding protein